MPSQLDFKDALERIENPPTFQDHTAVVRAVMENPFHVIHHLPRELKLLDNARSREISGADVLAAALQVEQLDAYTKDRMKLMLGMIPALERSERELPDDVRTSLTGIFRQTAGRPVEHRIELLRNLSIAGDRDNDDVIRASVRATAGLLEDGQSTIYSPYFSFYQFMHDGSPFQVMKSRLDLVLDIGQLGAQVGAGVGAVVGGVGGPKGAGLGAAIGAAIGGGGATLGAGAAAIWDWARN